MRFLILLTLVASIALCPLIPAIAGVDSVGKSSQGVWTASMIVSGDFTDVASNTHLGGCYLIRGDGTGISYVEKSSGAWAIHPHVSGTFLDISAIPTNPGALYTVQGDHSIGIILWNGFWQPSTLVAGNYVAVTGNTDAEVGGCYGVRVDGAIDSIRWSGGHWASFSHAAGDYIDIASDPVNAGALYALRRDGGVDTIRFVREPGFLGYKSTRIMDGDYIRITCSQNTTVQTVYAARSGGGVDAISYNGSWSKTSLGASARYADLAPDPRSPDGLFCVAVHEALSIPDAKALPAGRHVKCTGTVTAIFDGQFAIQAPDSTGGIRVFRQIPLAQEGYTATVSGALSTLPSSEKCIMLPGVSDMSQVPDHKLAAAETNNSGVLSKPGLLVKTTGRVTGKTTDTLTLSDGSVVKIKAIDPRRLVGCSLFEGDYVSLTGIASHELDGSITIPMVVLTGWHVLTSNH